MRLDGVFRCLLAATVVLCLTPAGRADTGPTSRPAQPNIILITIESLRADHVGCYGYERDTTPRIDALAAEAVTFEQASSVTSWTLTSHASIFTGLYPPAHRVILPQDRLADGYTTIAEQLAAGGYQCAAVIGGPYLRRAFNLHQGFEHYDESVAAPSNEQAHTDVTNPRMAAALERFLREKRDARRPFFLFAYYWDVHYDYNPPAPYDEMFVPAGAEPISDVRFGPLTELGREVSPAQLAYLIAQYDGEIRCTDDYLGRLWKLLRELGLWENTAIILTADHGEQFFEHRFLGHKHDIYAESVHVPLIVKLPGKAVPRRDSRVASLVDLYPTVLELAGCSTDSPHCGRSLLRDAPEGDRPVFYDLTMTWTLTDRRTGRKRNDSDRWIGVRSGRHKLVCVPGTRFWQIFDVQEDPRERHPLGPAHADTARELEKRLLGWMDAMKRLSGHWEQGPKAKLTPEEVRRLRALGYLE